jgi:hypothetical protein
MAIVTNTLLTFSAIGNREDLLDKIYNISPTDVPLQSMSDDATAKATLHEWQTEALTAAAPMPSSRVTTLRSAPPS